MDGYTKRQCLFIDVFLQQIDVFLASHATKNELTAEGVLDAASTALETAEAATVLAGLATAVPTAGGSLAIAGATLAVLNFADKCLTVVKGCLVDSSTTPSTTQFDEAHRKLIYKICLREAAFLIAVNYRHGLDEKFKDNKSVADFAGNCAARIVKKFKSDRDKQLPVDDLTSLNTPRKQY